MLSLLNVKYIFIIKTRLFMIQLFLLIHISMFVPFFLLLKKGYEDFVNKITTKKIYEKGQYGLYETDEQNFLPHFYITNTIITYDNNPKLHPYFESASSFFHTKKQVRRVLYS